MESPRKNDELPEVFRLTRLRDVCRQFINENRIDNQAKAFTVAWSRSNTFDFINSVCELIGYYGEER